MRTKVIKEKRYDIDWYLSNGFCYRTTRNLTWKEVLNCRKIAKSLGETIKHSYSHTVEYTYSY